MNTKRDPNRIPVMSYLDNELVAKIRTEIEGKKVPIKTGYGKMAKTKRPMGMADFVVAACEKATRRTTPSRKAMKWAEERTNHYRRLKSGK